MNWSKGSMAEPTENTMTFRISGTNGEKIKLLHNFLTNKVKHHEFTPHGAGAAIDSEVEEPKVHRNILGFPRKHDAYRDGLYGFNITLVSRKTDKSPEDIMDQVLKKLDVAVNKGQEKDGVSIHQFGDNALYQAALQQCEEMYAGQDRS